MRECELGATASDRAKEQRSGLFAGWIVWVESAALCATSYYNPAEHKSNSENCGESCLVQYSRHYTPPLLLYRFL